MNSPDKSNLASLFTFIVSNHDYISKSLLKGLKIKRNEVLAANNGLFLKEIEDQFHDRVKWIIASDITARSNLPVDEVLAFVETLNLEEFLK